MHTYCIHIEVPDDDVADHLKYVADRMEKVGPNYQVYFHGKDTSRAERVFPRNHQVGSTHASLDLRQILLIYSHSGEDYLKRLIFVSFGKKYNYKREPLDSLSRAHQPGELTFEDQLDAARDILGQLDLSVEKHLKVDADKQLFALDLSEFMDGLEEEDWKTLSKFTRLAHLAVGFYSSGEFIRGQKALRQLPSLTALFVTAVPEVLTPFANIPQLHVIGWHNPVEATFQKAFRKENSQLQIVDIAEQKRIFGHFEKHRAAGKDKSSIEAIEQWAMNELKKYGTAYDRIRILGPEKLIYLYLYIGDEGNFNRWQESSEVAEEWTEAHSDFFFPNESLREAFIEKTKISKNRTHVGVWPDDYIKQEGLKDLDGIHRFVIGRGGKRTPTQKLSEPELTYEEQLAWAQKHHPQTLRTDDETKASQAIVIDFGETKITIEELLAFPPMPNLRNIELSMLRLQTSVMSEVIQALTRHKNLRWVALQGAGLDRSAQSTIAREILSAHPNRNNLRIYFNFGDQFTVQDFPDLQVEGIVDIMKSISGAMLPVGISGLAETIEAELLKHSVAISEADTQFLSGLLNNLVNPEATLATVHKRFEEQDRGPLFYALVSKVNPEMAQEYLKAPAQTPLARALWLKMTAGLPMAWRQSPWLEAIFTAISEATLWLLPLGGMIAAAVNPLSGVQHTFLVAVVASLGALASIAVRNLVFMPLHGYVPQWAHAMGVRTTPMTLV